MIGCLHGSSRAGKGIVLKALAGACIWLVCLQDTGVAWSQQSGPSLTIEARLFGGRTGKFSDNVLAPDGPVLGNVVMGEDASTSTFVTVRIGPGVRPGAKVRLVAREHQRPRADGAPGTGSRKILDQTVAIAGASDAASYVGFWLAGTGCAPVTLTAYLQVSGLDTVSSRATLGFVCNE